MIPQSTFHGHRRLKMRDNSQWLYPARSTSLPDHHVQCGVTPWPQRTATLDPVRGPELDCNPISSAEQHCQLLGSCTEEGIQEHGFTFTWEKTLCGAGVLLKKSKGAPVCERGIKYFLVRRDVAHPARVAISCCSILPVCKVEGAVGPAR